MHDALGLALVAPAQADVEAGAGAALGNVVEGFEADQMALEPDLWVVGNVAKRGQPLIELSLASSPSCDCS